MADPVKIAEFEKLAQERTLQQLVKSGAVSANMLHAIAERLKVDANQIAKAIADGNSAVISAGQHTAAAIGETLSQSNQTLGAKLGSALGSLGKVFQSSFHGFSKSLSVEDIFANLSYGIKNVSRDFSSLSVESKIFYGALASNLAFFAGLYKSYQHVTKSSEDLYSTGLIFQHGMQGLADAASKAGMSIETYSKMLTEFGAAAGTLGVDRITQLNGAFLRATHSGSDLMMSQEEASKAFFSSVELLRAGGKLGSMSNQQIVAAGKDLIKNYNDLAAATGKNREEIAKNTKEIMTQPDVNMLMRLFPQDQQEQFAKTMSALGAQFGDGGKEMASLVAQVRLAHGSLGTLPGEMASIVNLVPGMKDAMIQASRGDLDGVKHMRQVIQAMDPKFLASLFNSFPEGAKTIQTWIQQTQQATDIERRRANMTAEQLAEEKQALREQERARRVQNEVTAAFAKFGNSFDKVAIALADVLIPPVKVVSYAFDKLANLINGITQFATDKGGVAGQAAVALVPTIFGILATGKGLQWIRTLFKKFSISGGLEEASGLKLLRRANPLNGLGQGMESIGKGIGGLGKGVGTAAEGVLSGLATGLEKLSNPRLFIGIGVLTAMAVPLYAVAKAVQQFDGVSWEGLAKAGVTVAATGVAMAGATVVLEPFAIALDAAMATLAAGLPVISLGSVALGVFGTALIPLAYSMKLASPLMTAFGDAISSIFQSIKGAGWKEMLAVGPALLGLSAALSASVVGAPLIWAGSKVLGNALSNLFGPLLKEVGKTGVEIVDKLAASLDSLGHIPGQGLLQIGQAMSIFGSMLTKNLLGGEIDTKKLFNFLDVFPILSSYKNSIVDAAGAVGAMSTIGLTSDKLAGIERLASLFTSTTGGILGNIGYALWHTDINPNLIKNFGDMFKTLGNYEADFVSGVNALDVILSLSITEDKTRGLSLLSSLFTSTTGGILGNIGYALWHTDINPNLIKNFGDMFSKLGFYTKAIISGAGALGALFSIDINETKMKGIGLLAQLFTSNTGGILGNIGYAMWHTDINPDLVQNFGKMFKEIGKYENDFVAGVNALDALFSLDVTENKMKGLGLLASIFTSTTGGVAGNIAYFIWHTDVNPDLVKNFGDLFAELGKYTNSIESGAGALAALFSIDIVADKVKSIGKLPSMFDNYNNVTATLKNIDSLISIFKKFEDNEKTIINGVNTINAINDLDTSGLSQVKDLNAAVFGQSSSVTVNTPPSTIVPTITDATTEYYSRTIGQFDKMIDLLTQANASYQKLLEVTKDGHRSTVSAINSASGTVY